MIHAFTICVNQLNYVFMTHALPTCVNHAVNQSNPQCSQLDYIFMTHALTNCVNHAANQITSSCESYINHNISTTQQTKLAYIFVHHAANQIISIRYYNNIVNSTVPIHTRIHMLTKRTPLHQGYTN